MLGIQPFGVREYLSSVLQQQFDDFQRPVLAGKVEGNMVCVGDRIDARGLFQKQLDTVKVTVDDGVNQGREVIVVDQVSGLVGFCPWLASP